MKKLILILLGLSPVFLKAQYNEWIPGKALTDSSHNNRNASLYGQTPELVLFWDQELNDSTTQLCYRNINSGIGEQHILSSEAGVKYSNPKILDLNPYSQPASYLVIFQTNEGNDIDLKSMRYQTDGTFSDPIILSGLPGDDINLTCSVAGTVAWENSGKIWVSQYISATNSFTEPFAIDSAGAYSPALESNIYLAYLKPNGDSTIVINEHVDNYQGNWFVSEKTTKSFLGKGSSLTSSDPLRGGYFAMQNKIGSDPIGLVIFGSSLSEIECRYSPSSNYTQPALVSYKIGVKSFFEPHFLAYVSDSLMQNEIFAESPYSDYDGLRNISQWLGDDKNLQLFEKWMPGYQIRVYLFWESERQGYTSIYHSYFEYTFYGGIDESSKAEAIIANPCPFDQETRIRFQATGKTNVRIMDLQGKEVKKLFPQEGADGWQTAIWDGTNSSGNIAPSGSYLIVCGSGNEAQSRIIIKK